MLTMKKVFSLMFSIIVFSSLFTKTTCAIKSKIYEKGMPSVLTSLEEIAHNYDTYLIDMVGVVCDGINPFAHAVLAINQLLEQKKQIIFLSNNPRPAQYTRKKLEQFGIHEGYCIITSGDLLHYTLSHSLIDKKIYHLGRNRQHGLLKNIAINLTSNLNDADAVIISCYTESGEDHESFDIDLTEIVASGKPVYCANPDRIALYGAEVINTPGYFAQKIRMMERSVIDLGKPSIEIYDFIMHMYPDIQLIKERTLMIGDTLETDICGAINFGVDSLLLMSGVTGLLTQGNCNLIQQSPYQPTYVMQYLDY